MCKSIPVLVLASKSPRRKLILEALGIDFIVRHPRASEIFDKSSSPEKIVISNAERKALSVSEQNSIKSGLIVGIDTCVWINGSFLGKPGSTEEAKKMLKKLSGKTHDVFSGLFIYSKQYGQYRKVVKSKVTFKKLSSNFIDSYCNTSEPYDKAGGYGVQGLGSLFIRKIEGSYTNVMGLPLEAFLTGLEKLTKIPLWKWFKNV